MEEIKEYYKILNLQPGASSEEVKQAYRNLALLWHPDRYPQDSRQQLYAEQKFKEINHAHDQLRAFLSQPQSSVKFSTPTKPTPTSPYNRGFYKGSASASTPFYTYTRPSPPAPPTKAEMPWGWLMSVFFSYILVGWILAVVSIPGWAWAFTWMAWIAIAISAASGGDSQHSWLLALIFAGSIAGWFAGHQVGGLITAAVWAFVGGALGAIAGSEAHSGTVLWVFTLGGVFAIAGLVAGTRTGNGIGALIGGLLGAVIGVSIGIISDAAFDAKRKMGVGSVFGFGLGAWVGAWTGAGSKAVLRAIESSGSDVIIGSWGAIAIVAGVISQMVAAEKLTEYLNEFHTFLILAAVSGVGLGLGWLFGA
ncbi:MAG: J domain-containing protein [Microcoleaceae cyanobacterium]